MLQRRALNLGAYPGGPEYYRDGVAAHGRSRDGPVPATPATPISKHAARHGARPGSDLSSGVAVASYVVADRENTWSNGTANPSGIYTQEPYQGC